LPGVRLQKGHLCDVREENNEHQELQAELNVMLFIKIKGFT